MIQAIYAEDSEYNSFECQTFPPGLEAFTQEAANGLKELAEVSDGVKEEIWAAYTVRLCRQRVETHHCCHADQAERHPRQSAATP